MVTSTTLKQTRRPTANPSLTRKERLCGVLLGTAVGDSLGLPAEGLSPTRAKKLFGGEWRQRLVLGRGMVSDDTEHTVFVAQSLLAHPNSPELFARRLGWCLRGWLLSLPAGIGFATLRAILRLWVGFRPTRSGVFSAGNGPAMRSAPLGAFFASSPETLNDYVRRATLLTHTDPKALVGAKAVAYLTAWCLRESPGEAPELETLLSLLRSAADGDKDWLELVNAIAQAHERDVSVAEFARNLGLEKGVTGYIYHTVPVAVYAWLRHFGDFKGTLTAVLDCGGDTDTVGAIVGALQGAVVGEGGIPDEWTQRLVDWPRGRVLLSRIGNRLADHENSDEPMGPVGYFWPAVFVRNLVFLAVVLFHGLRRLAPPY